MYTYFITIIQKLMKILNLQQNPLEIIGMLIKIDILKEFILALIIS